MASWTPVPLAGFSDEDEDAKTVLISRHARMAWDDAAHEADLTTPAMHEMRDDPQLVALEADASLDQVAPQPPSASAERLLTPWQMAMVVGMALPIAVAAAAWLLI